jgi:hypothetical protein
MQLAHSSGKLRQNPSYYARSSPCGKKMWRHHRAKLKMVAIPPSISRSARAIAACMAGWVW